MTAEEFELLSQENLNMDKIDFAEAYHKAKVEAISDEMEERLNEMTNDNETDLSWICGYQEAKNKLLKQ